MRLLCVGKAEVIDVEYRGYDIVGWSVRSKDVTEEVIRSVNKQFLPPDVIRLVEFDEHIEYDMNYTRDNIFYRDDYTCQYCGDKHTRSDLTIDHVLPKSRRKEFSIPAEEIGAWNNVVAACKECNVTKGNRTPEEAKMPLLNQPTEPVWVGRVRGIHSTNMKPAWQPFLKGDKKDASKVRNV